jgi:hypothetical protein
MSTIKSDNSDLTINASGTSKDIKFQADGTEVASISNTGILTATSFVGDGSTLSNVGVTGISSSANATAIKINSQEFVAVGGDFDPKKQLHIQRNNSDCMIILDTAGVVTDKIIAFCKEYGDGGSGSNYWSLGVDASDEVFTVAYDASSQASVGADRQFSIFDNGKCQSKNGIMFGTDTSDSNALDDYEEGTFTATLGGSSTQGSGPTTTGYYTKIGNQVHVTWTFTNVTVSGASGTVTVSGLPFTSTSTAIGPGGVTYKFNQPNHSTYLKMNNNATEIYHYSVQNQGAWVGVPVHVTSGLHWVASFTYRA